MSDVLAGQYPNPEDESSYLYWDGSQWIGEPKSEEEILGKAENENIMVTPAKREEVMVGLFGGKKAGQAYADEAFKLKQELAQLQTVVDKYGIADYATREKERSAFLSQIKDLENRIHALNSKETELKSVIQKLRGSHMNGFARLGSCFPNSLATGRCSLNSSLETCGPRHIQKAA